jgi:dTDP-4-dehydrorhamnose reductase
LSKTELDITNKNEIARAIEKYKPWAIINATGYVNLDGAESQHEICYAINADGPALIAEVCAANSLPFVTFSSDMVFNGDKSIPYTETGTIHPINFYGRSKAAGEQRVLENNSLSLIIRTSSFFGPWDKTNFAWQVLDRLKNHDTCIVVKDIMVSPTYIPDLVHTCLDLLIDEETGIWHVSNEGSITWEEFANEIADRGGYSKKNLITKKADQMGWIAKRPEYSVLQSEKGIRLPRLQQAVERYFYDKVF